MSATKHLTDEILDLSEHLDSDVRALEMLGDLVCGCREQIQPENLYYLLKPIIEHQRDTVRRMQDLFKGESL